MVKTKQYIGTVASASVLISLVVFLGLQIASLLQQQESMQAMHEQYCLYTDTLGQVLCDVVVADSSVEYHEVIVSQDEQTALWLNRESEHLKQSMLHYLKEQKLDRLVPRINLHEWRDYVQQVLHPVRTQYAKNIKQKKQKCARQKNRSTQMFGLCLSECGAMVPCVSRSVVVMPTTVSVCKQDDFYLCQAGVSSIPCTVDEATDEKEGRHNCSTAKKTKVSEEKKNKPLVHDTSFAWPIEQSKFWISSFFGPRKLPNLTWKFHYGLDMASVKGTPVRAAADGVVTQATMASSGYGNTIVIAHGSKYKTRYAHLDAILVCVGQKVKTGDCIGKVGDTGFIRKSGKDGSHLHFEVYLFSKKIDPLTVLA